MFILGVQLKSDYGMIIYGIVETVPPNDSNTLSTPKYFLSLYDIYLSVFIDIGDDAIYEQSSTR